ncbi:hypothetical protein MPLA_1530032 [Mesorhizobium sp. ORS 3359]|nr:hypothetical protein MPLA_1530032 [Mesorhizobium sp. ORS 3359]
MNNKNGGRKSRRSVSVDRSQFAPPSSLVILQKLSCCLAMVSSPQSFLIEVRSSSLMASHAFLNSSPDLIVFIPASVKKGDIFCGSSKADVPLALLAIAALVASESASALMQRILVFIFLLPAFIGNYCFSTARFRAESSARNQRNARRVCRLTSRLEGDSRQASELRRHGQ